MSTDTDIRNHSFRERDDAETRRLTDESAYTPGGVVDQMSLNAARGCQPPDGLPPGRQTELRPALPFALAVRPRLVSGSHRSVVDQRVSAHGGIASCHGRAQVPERPAATAMWPRGTHGYRTSPPAHQHE